MLIPRLRHTISRIGETKRIGEMKFDKEKMLAEVAKSSKRLENLTRQERRAFANFARALAGR